jgi:hypothetical protein
MRRVCQQAVKWSPAYQPRGLLTRALEKDLHAHYGLESYWAREVELQNPEMRFRPPQA